MFQESFMHDSVQIANSLGVDVYQLLLAPILTAAQFHISQLAPAGGLTNSPIKSAAEENDGVDSRA